MARYVAGDPRAFAPLHRALEPRLRARIAAIVGARGPIDDLVQLTFLLAHRARHRWVPRSTNGDAMVRAWFQAIARNVAITELRRGAVRPMAVTESVDDEPGTLPDPERTLDEQEHARRQHQAL
ncbi:MAG: hypothetical protein KDK70_21070, partial [Myxococcales bacterium]|nr:hypothetical protein [Myxococcales bacterium]